MKFIRESRATAGAENAVITLKVDEAGIEHLYFAVEEIDFPTLISRVGTFEAYNVMSALTTDKIPDLA